jgi:hypothetical protein
VFQIAETFGKSATEDARSDNPVSDDDAPVPSKGKRRKKKSRVAESVDMVSMINPSDAVECNSLEEGQEPEPKPESEPQIGNRCEEQAKLEVDAGGAKVLGDTVQVSV